MKDLFGQAILDFKLGHYKNELITETSISEKDVFPVDYLFRDFNKMPKLEQVALKLAHGTILDVGCGAGSHALYLQNNKKLNVTALDISANAAKVAKLRGVKHVKNCSLLNFKNQKFDTILLLMNGTGIFETLTKTPIYLQHLKGLLNEGGQILIDSTDIIYMFDEDEHGAKIIPFTGNYYGELTFTLHYKNQTEGPIPWLYLDYNLLYTLTTENGFKCEFIEEGDHFDYLARLSI